MISATSKIELLSLGEEARFRVNSIFSADDEIATVSLERGTCKREGSKPRVGKLKTLI